MQPLSLSKAAKRLHSELTKAEAKDKPSGQVMHVVSIGNTFYFAYERLRNAAEYRERHLLLRSAIERYLAHYVRLDKYEPAAAELVTELTQAGYLENDSIPLTVIAGIDDLFEKYSKRYTAIHTTKKASRRTVATWIYQTLSVQIENMIAPVTRNEVFMQFTYEHYYHAIDRAASGAASVTDQHYRIALFCAVQRAIFKSDIATTRYYCLNTSLPDLDNQPIEHFIELNKLIDELYQAPVTNRLFRLINRYGAPLRILREVVMGSKGSLEELWASRPDALSHIRVICSQQYAETHKTLNSRIAKTIFFIFLTKTLIGMSLEVPYDLFVYGALSWTPLTINILFPVIYMATIGARITTPSRHNTEVVTGYIDRILYEDAGAPVVYKSKRRLNKRSLASLFSVVYVIGFTGSIALLIWILQKLEFNVVNGAIFFIFFSAVSFLGFRLRRSARELEMLDEHQGILQTLIDFLSAPFVSVGHWLSDKYSKANIVTVILDLAIEMPLKTSLRLVQQWVSFLRDKQEEL